MSNTLGAAAVVALVLGLLGWIGWLLLRAARRHRQDTDALRQTKNDLALLVDARDADLRESNERLRSIIDSAVDGIIVIDGKGTIEAFNRGAEQLFGYSASEVVGRNVNILMPSPYHEEHDSYLARYLATGVQKIIGTGREVTGLRKDGSTFPLHLSVGKMMVGGAPKFTGILHDLSARVRIEERLREQTSLARLGEMAAVIAHEVKNPLAGVRGAIQVIGSRLPQDGKDALMVKEIVSRIDTLNELMKDLLLFARDDGGQMPNRVCR
jgi:PAS domain S-box-containing protein